MRSETEVKQAIIAILTSIRDAEVSPESLPQAIGLVVGAGLFEYGFTLSRSVDLGSHADVEALTADVARQAAEQIGQQAVAAVGYAMVLFHMLAAEFEAACPDADVQAFLRQRALEVAAEDDDDGA